jgi:hypothetical protein
MTSPVAVPQTDHRAGYLAQRTAIEAAIARVLVCVDSFIRFTARLLGHGPARRLASRHEPATITRAPFAAVPQTDPPHKRPTVAIRLPPVGRIHVLSDSTGPRDGYLAGSLVCRAVVRMRVRTYPRKIDEIPDLAREEPGDLPSAAERAPAPPSRQQEPAIRVPQCWLMSSTPLPMSTMPAICGQPKGSFQRKCAITATIA